MVKKMKARVILVAADVDVEEEERGGGDERIKGGGTAYGLVE